MQIVSRCDAIKAGLPRYFTGKACKHGHVCERHTRWRDCMECNIDRLRIYYSDRESARKRWKVQSAAKKEKNPERVKANSRKAMRAMRARNGTEKNREQWRKEYADAKKNNPSRIRAYDHAKRDRHRHAGENITAVQLDKLLTLQRNRCAYSFCRKSLSDGYHIDHIVPLALDGKNGVRNRQLLCPACNLSKNAKDPTDFARSRGLLI